MPFIFTKLQINDSFDRTEIQEFICQIGLAQNSKHK